VTAETAMAAQIKELRWITANGAVEPAKRDEVASGRAWNPQTSTSDVHGLVPTPRSEWPYALAPHRMFE
jgi:hypothetical protein